MHCVFSNRNIPNKEKQETRKKMPKILFRTVSGCFPVRKCLLNTPDCTQLVIKNSFFLSNWVRKFYLKKIYTKHISEGKNINSVNRQEFKKPLTLVKCTKGQTNKQTS